jgi:hypothetical protein
VLLLYEDHRTTEVFIPSRGRAGESLTIAALVDEGRQPILVVPMEERREYSKVYPTAFTLGVGVQGIGLTRQWILKNARSRGVGRMWILDDDLHHPQMRDYFGGPYRDIGWSEWLGGIEDLSADDRIGLAGGTLRQFGWSEEAAVLNTRIGYAVLMNTAGPWDYWPFLHEDTDMNLQVLTAGYKTLRFPQYIFSTGHMGQLEGGCQQDYLDGLGESGASALVTKWKKEPGLVRIRMSKKGIPVTRVDWSRFRKEGLLATEEEGGSAQAS